MLPYKEQHDGQAYVNLWGVFRQSNMCCLIEGIMTVQYILTYGHIMTVQYICILSYREHYASSVYINTWEALLEFTLCQVFLTFCQSLLVNLLEPNMARTY